MYYNIMRTNNNISYENDLLLAAILCLLLVILFVLLLHIYARWLLSEGHLCRTSIAGVFGPTTPPRLTRSHTMSTTYTYDITSISSCSHHSKGLDLKVIDSIPSFVYGEDHFIKGVTLECSICLSFFEEKERGKCLPRCSHSFHVECIDMWLFCNSTCPICRAQVVTENNVVDVAQRRAMESSGSLSVINNPLAEEQRNDGGGGGGDDIVVDIRETSEDCNDQNLTSSESYWSLTRMLSRNRSERRVYPSSFATGHHNNV